VLVFALAIVLVAVSAALGSAMNDSPPVPAPLAAAPQSAPDTILTGLVAEHRCLTEALYYEARGEGRAGEQAVAEVVFHRVSAHRYGHSICAVVYEGSSHRGCQFSFTCNGDLHRPREAQAWQRSAQLAAQILSGEAPLRDATGGATHYHAVSVRPRWAPTLRKTAQIGNHIFYRGTREI